MSGIDLYEDGFPHGTKQGFEKGCRGRSCPGVMELGISCLRANERYNGDYNFRKLVDSGVTPADIVASEEGNRFATATPKPVPVSSPPEVVPAVPKPTSPVAAKPSKHGTTAGYSAGCRDDNCEGVRLVGRSCRTAVAEYQRALKAKKNEGKKPAQPAKAKPVAKPAQDPADPTHPITPPASLYESLPNFTTAPLTAGADAYAAEKVHALKVADEKASEEDTTALAEDGPTHLVLEVAPHIKQLQEYVGHVNRAHGFREYTDSVRDDPEALVRVQANALMLIVTEVAEAHEELRKGHAAAETYYPLPASLVAEVGEETAERLLSADGRRRKPEGVPSEIADVFIRCLDFADSYGFDLGQIVAEKILYNETRPYKHGKKF